MKRLSFITLIVSALGLFYYLFLLSYEFTVSFKGKTVPGDVIGTIRIWNRGLDEARIVEVDSFNSLTQIVKWDDRNYVLSWQFKPSSDSITKVKVRISQPDRRLLNKLLVPFTQQPIETDAEKMVSLFYNILKEHLEITSVNIKGVAELDPKFCLCRPVETKQIEKANGMMMEYGPLSTFIADFGLEPNGQPMVIVKAWSHTEGSLKFDFCFPILPKTELPGHDLFFYKEIPSMKALKAEYFGNYITSDRAWYELLNYSAKYQYKINGLPVEVFHNNPNLGMREQEWKAEVYLPFE